MIIPEPKKVLDKRRNIEKRLCRTISVSVEDLAEFFNTNPKVIRTDLSELGIELKELQGVKSAKLEALQRARDKEILSRIEKGEDKSEVLSEYGLWRIPRNLTIANTDILVELSDKMICDEAKKNKIISLLELGWSSSDVYKRVGGLDSVNRRIIGDYVRMNNLSPTYIKEKDIEMQSIAIDTIKYELEKSRQKGETFGIFKAGAFKDVISLTGASDIKMQEAVGRPSIAKHRKQKLENDRLDRGNIQKEKQALKIEIYREWTSGNATQQELAEKHGLTRRTIMNYIYDIKAQNLSTLSEEIPTVRRRNSNKKNREAVAHKKVVFLSKYFELENKESLSIAEIAKQTRTDLDDVKKFLLQENLIPTLYENSNLKKIEVASTLSKASYELGVKSLFGYGPNTGITKTEKFIQKEQLQKETMYGLNNSQELRQSFNENRGDLVPFFITKNPKAKEEYDKKYASVNENTNSFELEMG